MTTLIPKYSLVNTSNRTIAQKFGEQVSVKDFGAVGDGVADDTAAIIAAIAYIKSLGGGEVFFPAGIYVTSATIYVPSFVSLQGTGYISRVLWNGVDTVASGSCIYGKHTGAAIVSLKGAFGCGIRNLSMYGGWVLTPKTGLCLGRSSGASCGRHIIDSVEITGHFSIAAIYSIASEENTFIKLLANVLGGGAKYTFYTSDADDLSVDSLVTSSNWNSNTITGFTLLHQANDTGVAVIYINIRLNTAGWTFRDGFTGATTSGPSSHVQLNLANVSATANCSSFVFDGIGSESSAAGFPTLQHYYVTGVAATLNGLRIRDCVMGQTLGGTQYFLYSSDNITLNGFELNAALNSKPSRLWRLMSGVVNTPGQNVTIVSGCSNSTVNAKNTISTGVSGQIVKTMSLNTVIGPTIFTGGGPDVMVVSEATVFTGTSTPTLVVEIDGSTAPETFKWSLDGGSTFVATLVPITTADQLLQDGIYIRFSQGTGIAVGSRWTTVIAPVLLPTQTA